MNFKELFEYLLLGIFFLLIFLVVGYFYHNISGINILAISSGSMSPILPMGSLALVAPRVLDNYWEGDIISFKQNSQIITHRIQKVIGSGSFTVYQTKGDANSEVDRLLVRPEQLLGRVVVQAPFLGYVPLLCRTWWGLLFFIYLPCVSLIVFELTSLGKNIKDFSILGLFFVFCAALFCTQPSQAKFFNSVKFPGGILTAEWVTTDHIVVNEVMYYSEKGRGDDQEWFELYNPTEETLDLAGFTVSDEENTHLFVPGSLIPPRSRAIVANDALYFFQTYGFYPDYCLGGQGCGTYSILLTSLLGGLMYLSDEGDQVVLRDPSGLVVDLVVWGREDYLGTVAFMPVPNSSLISRLDSIERFPAGLDTDNCLSDMKIRHPGTPGW